MCYYWVLFLDKSESFEVVGVWLIFRELNIVFRSFVYVFKGFCYKFVVCRLEFILKIFFSMFVVFIWFMIYVMGLFFIYLYFVFLMF